MNEQHVVVAIPESAPLDALGPLARTLLVTVAAADETTGDVQAAEVVVIDDDTLGLLPALGTFPRLRLVQSVTAGVDALLPDIPPGVVLCNASGGVHDGSVSEWVVTVILASLRGLPAHFAAQGRHQWPPAVEQPILAQELAGRNVCIIGYGAIGRAVEQRLAPFGMHITRVALRPRAGVCPPDEIPRLLPSTQIVVLAAPLTDATRDLVDAGFLAALPDGALVVNVSRGGLVDTEALLAELRRGRLRAALDVTRPEPLPARHPLWSAPNCIITPHVAGTTTRWRERAYRFVGDQLRRYERGEPLQNVRTSY
jgi:phosphoglycerate dehydrogenase-like enzyme